MATYDDLVRICLIERRLTILPATLQTRVGRRVCWALEDGVTGVAARISFPSPCPLELVAQPDAPAVAVFREADTRIYGVVVTSDDKREIQSTSAVVIIDP